MREAAPPLILITNDDGIASPGLRAAVQAVLSLGEPLVVAPARQWSGAARSMPPGPEGRIAPYPLDVEGQPPFDRQLVSLPNHRPPVTAYQVDASPALTVLHGVLELAPRRPALLISGINYGVNLGSDVTVSGTVGAALQGADCGIPSLAVSLQTPKEMHVQPSDSVDFTAAIHFTRLFARRMLQVTLPFDVDVIKVDVPDDATPDTPWRLTRVSRHAYYVSVSSHRTGLAELVLSDALSPSKGGVEGLAPLDYELIAHPERTEPDSDIYALAVDRVVSVAPLSLDLTSRTPFGDIEPLLCGPAPL